MSDTYTKLFSSITESTIVSEPVATRWLWVTLLAMANAQGEVYGSIPGLARRANLTIEETERGLATFYAPDPYSRTKENEGRRIEAMGGGDGWVLLNHAKYAAIRNEAERADYKRQWDRENRPSGHARQSDSSPTKSDTSDSSPISPTAPTTPALALTPKEKKEHKKKQPQQAATFVIPPWLDSVVWAAFLEMRRKKRAPATVHACGLVITELIKLRDKGFRPEDVLNQSIRNTWTDVYPIKTDEKTHANNSRNRESVADRASRFASEGDEAERRRTAQTMGAHGSDLRT